MASGSSSSTFSETAERGDLPGMAISSAVASRAMTRASSGDGGLAELIRLLTDERRVGVLPMSMSMTGRKEVSGESEGEG